MAEEIVENVNPDEKEEAEEIDSESVILHLKDLVNCYEELVSDMTRTIHQTREDFDVCQKDVRTETVFAGTPCENCKKSEQLVENLKNQVDALQNGKKTVTALWHASAEQIEQLESRLKSKSITTNDIQMKVCADSQVKLLQDYIIRLEGRIEQTSAEKNFYRRKLMETKLENESVMKKLIFEKQKDIEVVKSTYLKEIEHLKQLLERERTFLQSAMEKKLEEERKIWNRQEKERRENLKKSWIVQLEPIVVEQEAVFVRETQLSDKLRQTQLELYQAKQILLLYQQQQSHLQSSPLLSAKQTTENQTGQLALGGGPADNNKRRIDDDNSLGYSLDKYGGQHLSPEATNKHNCHHEECVKYSMHEKVLQENERLGEEYSRLQRSKQIFEKEYEQHALRLEQRIRDLEGLNYKLQAQMLNQHNNAHRENVFSMKTKTGGGGGDVDKQDGRFQEYFSEAPTMTYTSSPLLEMNGSARFPVESEPIRDGQSNLKTTNNNNNNSTIDKLERFSKDVVLRHKVNEQRWLIREEENRKILMDHHDPLRP